MKIRKVISVVLSCLILMACLPVTTFAASSTMQDMDVSVNGDGSVIASLDSSTRTLTIKGKGAIKDFSSGQFTYSLYTIDHVVVEEGITRIGKKTFQWCDAVDIRLPSTLESIGASALNRMDKITSLEIPANVITIENDAVSGAKVLENLSFAPNSKLETIGSSAFSSTKIKSLNLPNGIREIGAQAFLDCTPLTDLTIPSSVEKIGANAFKNCSNLSLITNLASSNQSISTSSSFDRIAPNATIYLYGTNTNMIAATASMTTPMINYLDDPVLSGVLDNGVKWTYDPSTSTITFEGSGDIPSYTNGTQPWYGALQHYGGANDWLFGEGISGIGSGTFVGGGVGGSGLNVWAPSSLGSSISSQLPNANVGDIKDNPSNTEKPKTGIWNFVDDVEVAFPDEKPRIINGEIVSPLRFIFQDLGATVLWSHEKQAAIVRKEENGNKVEIVLTPGSSSMIVNGREFSNTEIGLDATVFLENGRCFLPGRAIIKAWETVQFKAVHNEPTSYEDYYYRQDTPVEGGDDKLQDIPTIPDWQEEGVVITPDNEQEVINGGSIETPPTSSTSSMDVIVDIEPTQFKFTVPIAVSLSMSADGVISVGSGYVVYNRCPMGPIIIKDIKVVPLTSWDIADFDADFKEMKASTKQFGMRINGIQVPSNGAVPLNGSLGTPIKCGQSKELNFDFKLPAQKKPINKLAMAAVVFTVDFDKV